VGQISEIGIAAIRRPVASSIAAYKAGDRQRALAGFAAITNVNPGMADAWLGRLACGDHDLDTMAAAHANSRALYRETRRLGLTASDDPVQVEADLMAALPPSEWLVFAHQVILHGRSICQAKRPLCGECTLSDVCPSSTVQAVSGA